MRNYEEVCAAARRIKAIGCRIAIDDLGSGYSSLRGWSELKPDLVKIDRYFVSGVDKDPVKSEFLRSIVDLARTTHCRIVAEGVETPGECRELLDIGADFLQGYFLARPEAKPRLQISSQARAVWPGTHDSAEENRQFAASLAVSAEALPPSTPAGDIMNLMHDRVDITSVPIVDGKTPVGIVRRTNFFSFMSQRFHADLYSRRPIRDVPIMESSPLCIDVQLRLDQVSRLVTTGAKRQLDDDFIITRDGEYVGLGQTITLLKRITEQQLTSAKHANPLTLLPGNVPIYDALNRLLARGQPFVVCYIDLDHFKPYNDHYGYAKGDQILTHTAQLLSRVASKRLDFVGHVGGDDFVVVFRSADWELRLARLVGAFESSVARFYSKQHINAGGMKGVDRFAVQRTFSLMTLSIAVVDSSVHDFKTAEEVAHALTPIKAEAKARDGNTVVIRDCDGIRLSQARAPGLDDDQPAPTGSAMEAAAGAGLGAPLHETSDL
ncbi:MAG: bifunctional diguanylate cyclase/phosphodiesterase [Pseudomonadota bacterium]